jgi:hypothetical protein
MTSSEDGRRTMARIRHAALTAPDPLRADTGRILAAPVSPATTRRIVSLLRAYGHGRLGALDLGDDRAALVHLLRDLGIGAGSTSGAP